MTTAAAYLPPIPQPPHDPTSLRLGGRAGWPGGKFDGTRRHPAGHLSLAPTPGMGRTLAEPGGSFGGLTPPAHVALGPEGSVYLLDARSLHLKRFDPCDCAFHVVPCFGGRGRQPRQLDDPHGIGICRGTLFVCDTANHRVGLFALWRMALLGYWAPPSAKLTRPWEPFDVAFDSRGRVFVSDPANGLVHRFSPGGRWEKALAGLGTVSYLAIDNSDWLHLAVDGMAEVRTVDVEGEPAGSTATRPEELAETFPPLPFEVDAAGNLHMAALCVPGGGEPVARGMAAGAGGPPRGVFDSSGDPLKAAPAPAGPSYPTYGVYITPGLDSRIPACQWHRILLDAEVPPGASLVVSTHTSEVPESDEQVALIPDEAWETRQAVRQPTGEWDCLVRSGGGRFLWLRVELRGGGGGNDTPLLRGLEIEFPRVSLRRHLPAVFGAEPNSADFTDRFLALFDVTLRGIERRIDHQAQYFDPMSAPAERGRGHVDFLTWLGSWVGVSLDRRWPESRRRAFLKAAGRLYDLRGTREGLWQQLLLFMGIADPPACCRDAPACGARACRPKPLNCAPAPESACAWRPPPLILEHYQLRRWLFVGAGRLGEQAALWGRRVVNRLQLGEGARAGETQLVSTPDPLRDPFHVYAHQFTVFVPARFGRTEAQRKSLETLLRAESPGHTRPYARYVEPRFRIGVQSSIGLDAVIASPPGPTPLGRARLGKTAVVGGPAREYGNPPRGGAPRVGSTTKLT